MRVTKRVIFDIRTGLELFRESFNYEGPVESCCGGPSQQQKTAAASQQQLSDAELAQYNLYSSQVDPFYEQTLSQGLPYFNQESQYGTSDIGQQITQAKANEAGKLGGFGSALPSGFAEQENADIGIGGAQAFDQNMMSLLSQNFAAKMAAAQGMNPQAPAATAAGANTSIMQAPLQNNFWGNLISGIVQGSAQAGSAYLGA